MKNKTFGWVRNYIKCCRKSLVTLCKLWVSKNPEELSFNDQMASNWLILEKPKTMYGLGIGTASAQIQSANEQGMNEAILNLHIIWCCCREAQVDAGTRLVVHSGRLWRFLRQFDFKHGCNWLRLVQESALGLTIHKVTVSISRT